MYSASVVSRLGRQSNQRKFIRFSSSQSGNVTDSASNKGEMPPEAMGSTIVQGPSLLTLTGVHRPNPSMFQLPGLRSLPFWTRGDQVAYNDPTVKRIVSHVERHVDLIRNEYQAAVVGINRKNEDDVLEHDYDLGGKGGEHSDRALHQGQWDWHSFILNGVKQPAFSKLCPETAKCLEEIGSDLFSTTPFSFSFFSTLQPGAMIKPHSAPMNLRLRVHLPLMVDEDGDCGITCGGQERKWKTGQALVLDDSYIHEVWNNSR